MAIRETILIGENVLRETASEVTKCADSVVKQTILDLRETMRANNLVGMAAPQIGVPLSIFVSEIREGNARNAPVEPFSVYINPKIVQVPHETDTDWEGCGSIPWVFGKVTRSKQITLQYMDENGVSHETELSGLTARIAQHEVDHLNGILFTDICDPKTLVSREYYLEHIAGK